MLSCEASLKKSKKHCTRAHQNHKVSIFTPNLFQFAFRTGSTLSTLSTLSTGSAEVVASAAARTLRNHAPGARMTVVYLKQTNSLKTYQPLGRYIGSFSYIFDCFYFVAGFRVHDYLQWLRFGIP